MFTSKATSNAMARAAICLLLTLCSMAAVAQKSKNQLLQGPDTVPFFRGVAVSIDLVGPVQYFTSDYGQYEAALRVNLKDRYFPVVEVGIGKADAEDASTRLTYKTSAPFYRVGLDLNLLRNKHDDYRLYGGARYGYTSFKFDVFNPGITDPVWGESVEFKASDVDSNYHWAEIVAGIDAKIWRFFRLGWSLRYKHRLFHKDNEFGNPWYVPGYGKQGNVRLGGTFNVTIEL